MAETAPLRRVSPESSPDKLEPNRSTDSPRNTDPTATPRQEPLWRHMLGDHLRHLRHDRGETLAETSTRAGVSPQYLSEIERGIKEPSSEMIAAVAGALDVGLIDLTLAVAENLRIAHNGLAARITTAQVTTTGMAASRVAFALAA